MYVARFGLETRAFSTLAARLGDTATGLVPDTWLGAVLDASRCDLALRLTVRADAVGGLLLLGGTDGMEPLEELGVRLEHLARTSATPRLVGGASEFDAATEVNLPHQLRLNPRGYRVGDHHVVADFRLRPLLDVMATRLPGTTTTVCYQVNLRRYAPAREDERAVRKHLAALRLESPFPAPLTALQTVIASRLLQPGFLSDEYLATDDRAFLVAVTRNVEESFASTMSSFGFIEPPIETGRFDEELVSGLHSSYAEGEGHFIHRSAGAVSRDEVRRLLRIPPPSAISTPAATGAQVFLSYSSRDFAAAQETCQRLESQGITCWIAPRNIAPGEAYPDAIIRGISGCRAMVVLLSESSNLSPHVHREIERALHRNAVVIPLRLEDIVPTGAMEYLLATQQWLDVFGAALDPSMNALIRRLQVLLAA